MRFKLHLGPMSGLPRSPSNILFSILLSVLLISGRDSISSKLYMNLPGAKCGFTSCIKKDVRFFVKISIVDPDHTLFGFISLITLLTVSESFDISNVRLKMLPLPSSDSTPTSPWNY